MQHLCFISGMLYLTAILLLTGCQSENQVEVTAPYEGPLEAFALDQVELLAGPFRTAQLTDESYILELDVNRLLAPFMDEAGITPLALRYGNWEETGLDGHIGGHYLSALSQMYAATGNDKLLERLEYMIGILAECQQKNGNGYVGGIPGGAAIWEEIRKGNIDAGSFSLNGKWVPLYNIHKLYAGLRDAYLIAGNKNAREMLVALTDWMIYVTGGLSDEQMQQMLRSEHGGLNEVFADVAAITGHDKYLVLAKRFSHQAILDPLLEEKDALTGLHANTQIPKVIGFKRVADLENNQEWHEATRFFWNTVVNNRTVSIGGNSVREHFHATDDFSSMVASNQGPETCNTYNMLRLTEMLFLSNPEAGLMDYYEKAVHNHILSSQHPEGGFVYFTPMRPQHYRVYSQPHQSFWCCVGSGLENHARYGQVIYAKGAEDLFVNLFIPSRLSWKEKGAELVQKTVFPEEEGTTIALSLDQPVQFGLNLRHPSWAGADQLAIYLNGEKVDYAGSPSSYVRLDRVWQDGDEVSIRFPLQPRVEHLPDGSDWVSILKGPIVMAAVADSSDLQGIWADDSRMAHVADGPLYPLDQSPTIIAANDQEILSAIRQDNQGALLLNTVEASSKKEAKLVPFYKVHEARYMIYWPVMSEEEYNRTLSDRRERELANEKLEELTVDQVATGEQQPEAEHNFKGAETNSGSNDGEFWRDAAGWFSYDLSNKGKAGKVLRITYFSGDSGRKFKIYLNGKLFQHVSLTDQKEAFYHVDYAIPAEYLQSEKLNVRFEAEKGSRAGGVYYIRLMKEGIL